MNQNLMPTLLNLQTPEQWKASLDNRRSTRIITRSNKHEEVTQPHESALQNKNES